MEQRPVYVKDTSGGTNAASVAIIGIIVIAAIVALFVWQPWNAGQHNTTIVAPPGTSSGTH